MLRLNVRSKLSPGGGTGEETQHQKHPQVCGSVEGHARREPLLFPGVRHPAGLRSGIAQSKWASIPTRRWRVVLDPLAGCQRLTIRLRIVGPARQDRTFIALAMVQKNSAQQVRGNSEA